MFAIIFSVFSLAIASEVTGTISSNGVVAENNTSGGGGGSTSTEGGNGTLSGTVTGGSTANSGGATNGQKKDGVVIKPNSATNSQTINLDPNDNNGTDGELALTGDNGEEQLGVNVPVVTPVEGSNLAASAAGSGFIFSNWFWAIFFILLLIIVAVYIYIRNYSSKKKLGRIK